MVRDGALFLWKSTFDFLTASGLVILSAGKPGSPHLDGIFVDPLPCVQRCSEWGVQGSTELWNPTTVTGSEHSCC